MQPLDGVQRSVKDMCNDSGLYFRWAGVRLKLSVSKTAVSTLREGRSKLPRSGSPWGVYNTTAT